MHTPGDFLTEFPIRIMDEIQRHVVKWGKRNVISQHYHAKDDKKAITAWRLDLNGILQVFNVGTVTSARLLLTSRFQTGLGMDAHATVSDDHQDAANKDTIVSDARRDSSNAEVTVPDFRHDVSNAHPIVSDVRSDIVNTRTVVSDIHRNKLKSREDVDGRNQAVSTTHTLPVTE